MTVDTQDFYWGQALWSQQQAKLIDAMAQEQFLVPSLALMERAGAAVFEAILRHYSCKNIRKSKFKILVGSGNNGGDGLVVARYLMNYGCSVQVVRCFEQVGVKPSAEFTRQQSMCAALGIKFSNYRFGSLGGSNSGDCDVVIDAIFGIGIRLPLTKGMAYDVIRELGNLNDQYVVAIDVPSGLSADSMKCIQHSAVVKADLTVTFGAKKICHVHTAVRQYSGKIICKDIGFPQAAIVKSQVDEPFKVVEADCSLLHKYPMAPRSEDINKYERGHVLVLGGSEGKRGAAVLAARAVLRAGAGWVTLGTDSQELISSCSADFPELTFEQMIYDDRVCPKKLGAFLQERNVRGVIVGPGFVHNPLSLEAMKVLADWSQLKNGKVVIDAGALSKLDQLIGDCKLDPNNFVLTPHPGEWRRVSAQLPEIDQRQALGEALASFKKWGVTAIYKSSTPLIFDVNQKPYQVIVLTHQSNRLARAGSGDVLTGLIMGYLLRGLSGPLAATKGLIDLEKAAQLAAIAVGDDSVLAMDIIERLGLLH
jgi:ADP-dependent NAD(P)H-hydrate dehydratase / NAD(P)H-hydrate epimerase